MSEKIIKNHAKLIIIERTEESAKGQVRCIKCDTLFAEFIERKGYPVHKMNFVHPIICCGGYIIRPVTIHQYAYAEYKELE